MDVRTYFQQLYDHAHGLGEFPTAVARFVLTRATPEQMRLKLPGHNPIAWTIWHIARGEDWGVNTMLRCEEQVLTRDGWNQKMGVSELGFGYRMAEEDADALGATIDLDPLRSYYDAVCEQTKSFIETFDFDTLNDPIDV